MDYYPFLSSICSATHSNIAWSPYVLVVVLVANCHFSIQLSAPDVSPSYKGQYAQENTPKI